MKKIALIIAIAFVLVGCSKSASEKLVGKWENTEGEKEQTEFFDDGTLIVEVKGGLVSSASGKWHILKDQRLKIELAIFGQTFTTLSKLSFKDDNNLTITPEEGKATKLQRVISTK